jgi:hypothetical protein
MNYMRIFYSLLLFVFSSFVISAQTHWESMVKETVVWRYLAANSEPSGDWYKSGFNDSGWKTGQGGIGYGDNDDNTVLTPPVHSLYMRYSVSLPDVSIIKDLLLDIDYDDAFILYINGVECARSSNIVGDFPPYNARPTTHREAQMYQGGSPERHVLNPSSLQRGLNTFALHILNDGPNSSDMSARVWVHANINYPSMLYGPPPAWFEEPLDFTVSHLPLIMIDTDGQTITQDDKVMALMRVVNNREGLNSINDSFYEYEGMVGIKIRGFTSAGFPKKGYTVETRYPDGSNLNVPILGMPRENDWVFHGPYSDKSLMRNVLAYHLGNRTGTWSPRTRFFEFYLNGVYNGVYVLTEKIKIDKGRLDLAKIKPDDVTGDQLTGGYILKLDRPETTDVDGKDYWISPYRAPTRLQQRVFFIHHHPKGRDLQPVQHAYIRDHMTAFEDVMYSNSYADRETGYRNLVDIISFVDYYIISELSRNLDGYRISTFIHKDRDSRGGKIKMGPYWDYNICFGNANFFSAGRTDGWIIDGMGDGDAYAMPFWWAKFRLDPIFNSLLKRRWTDWRESYINTSYLNNFIDSCALELGDAVKRNFRTWNVLGRYVWPNNYVGSTYTDELNYLKNWLRDRIIWMDSQIEQLEDITSGAENAQVVLFDMIASPNPFIGQLHFKFFLPAAAHVDLVVRNLAGQEIYRYNSRLQEGFHDIPVDLSKEHHLGNLFVYQLLVDGQQRKSGKLIRE